MNKQYPEGKCHFSNSIQKSTLGSLLPYNFFALSSHQHSFSRIKSRNNDQNHSEYTIKVPEAPIMYPSSSASTTVDVSTSPLPVLKIDNKDSTWTFICTACHLNDNLIANWEQTYCHKQLLHVIEQKLLLLF
jgi:hypothetical protein